MAFLSKHVKRKPFRGWGLGMVVVGLLWTRESLFWKVIHLGTQLALHLSAGARGRHALTPFPCFLRKSWSESPAELQLWAFPPSPPPAGKLFPLIIFPALLGLQGPQTVVLGLTACPHSYFSASWEQPTFRLTDGHRLPGQKAHMFKLCSDHNCAVCLSFSFTL